MESINKKEKFGLYLTVLEIFLIMFIFKSNINISSFKFLLYVTSFTIISLIKYYNRKYSISYHYQILVYSISCLIFNITFCGVYNIISVNHKYVSFLSKKLLVNSDFLIILLFSCISGIVIAGRNKYFGIFEFSEKEGVFKYLMDYKSSITNSIINIWMVTQGISYIIIFIYNTFISLFLRLIFFLIRIETVSSGAINNLIKINMSVLIYYLILECIEKILVYNFSIRDIRFNDYKLMDNFDLEQVSKLMALSVESQEHLKNNYLFYARYIFYNVSANFKKYKPIRNKICKSRSSVNSLIKYIKLESQVINEMCNEFKDEHRKLENKLFMTIPQVNNTVKKVKNYSFIDKYFYLMIYKWRVMYLRMHFIRNIKYIMDISILVNEMINMKDEYPLIEDLSEEYGEIYKTVIGYIHDVENTCKIDFKIKIL